MGATGCARGGWGSCGRSASSFCVVTCAVHSCATRCSISPLLYPQLLAIKEITSRHPVGVGALDFSCCIRYITLLTSINALALDGGGHPDVTTAQTSQRPSRPLPTLLRSTGGFTPPH